LKLATPVKNMELSNFETFETMKLVGNMKLKFQNLQEIQNYETMKLQNL
jgi:hypothetical protein